MSAQNVGIANSEFLSVGFQFLLLVTGLAAPLLPSLPLLFGREHRANVCCGNYMEEPALKSPTDAYCFA